MTTRKKPVVLAEKNNRMSGSGRKCPVHLTSLTFRPEHVSWMCAEPDCKYREYPERLINKTIPTFAHGPLALLGIEDDSGNMTYYLHNIDNNILVDVTDAMGPVVTPVRSGDQFRVVLESLLLTKFKTTGKRK